MAGRKAILILHDKVVLRSGVIVETKIWWVVGDPHYPDGLKYSLYAVREGVVLVGYDNHHPKGHHRHLPDREVPYDFTSLEVLRSDFKAELDIELIKKGLS